MTSSTAPRWLENLIEARDTPSELVDRLIMHFRRSGKPVELFEALKMRTRLKLGLPAVATADEPKHSNETERAIEDGLLDACRETGAMMIRKGRIAEGFMYLRPVGDNAAARRLLETVDVTEENYDDMIQILVHEQVDVGRGYGEVLKHQGTCNSITLYEQSISQMSKADRQAAAVCLLDHLYEELLDLVRKDIRARHETVEDHETLGQIVETREWLLAEGGYHLDTTHLASTVRIASVVTDHGHLQRAYDLTQYGRRLHHQFQYPGDEPFAEFYPNYAAFYSTLLGKDVEAGLKLFGRKARTVDVQQDGTGAIETYIDLLDRVGQQSRAIREAITLIPKDVPTQSVIGLLLDVYLKAEIADQPELREHLLEYCVAREDMLAYAAVAGATIQR